MAAIKEIGKAYRSTLCWISLLVGLNLGLAGFMIFMPEGSLRTSLAEVGRFVIPLIACIPCFGFRKSAIFRRLSQSRHVPTALGLSILFLALGALVESLEVRYFHRSSSFGWADLFFLSKYAFVIASITIWPSRPLPGALRWRAWSDGLVLLLALMAFGWVTLIGPSVIDSNISLLGVLVDSAYPVGDILIVFSVLQMMRKGFDPRFRLATHLFVLALGINTVGDLYLAMSQIAGISVPQGILDAVLPFTASLIAAAAVAIKSQMQQPGFEDIQNDERIVVSQRTWTLYAPYVLVPAVGVLVLHASRSTVNETIRNGLYFCGLGLIIAILIRQLIVIAENGSLYSRLREAYAELEEKNEQILKAAEDTATMNDRLRSMTDELAGQNRTLSESNELLERMATKDGMTGLANHRAFQERLKEEIAQAKRIGNPLVLALIDVDFFKQYNDNYGHPAGDEVLRSIAKLLEESTREGDLAARYGGEEFALLLPHTNVEAGSQILERLREAVSTFPFQHRRVTLSVGMSGLNDECSSPEKMIDFADKALYLAKNRGRNQVVSACGVYDTHDGKHGGFDLATPMGYAKMLSAGLQYYPQALAHEPQCALIGGLLATLELRDPMSRGHAQRTMQYAMRIAEEAMRRGEIKMSPSELRSLAFGALLHDIGRLGISERILASIEPFTLDERREIERHTLIGSELVQRFPALGCAIPHIKHHHERWDGGGYPAGLKEEDIPLGARILAYADALNAMSTDRPYAAKRTYEEIRAEFQRHAGGQFDPALLNAFLAVPDEDWDQLRINAMIGPSIAPMAA